MARLPQPPSRASGQMPASGQMATSGLITVLEENRGALLQFLAARCGSLDDAQDVLQDLWIKVGGAQATGPIAAPRAYLFRMANNLVLDRARGRQRAMRRERAWLDADGADPATASEDRTDPGEPADEAIARRQEAEILRGAIAALPDGAGRALRLYRFEGLGQSEIARVMGISRSGVEKHLALAMKRLRQALADCGCFGTVASSPQGPEGGERLQGGHAQREQGQ